MANVDISDVVRVNDAVFLEAVKAEKKYEKSPDLVKLSFAVRKWMAELEEFIRPDQKAAQKKPLSFKVSNEVAQKLRSAGLRRNSRCDLELSVGGWSSDRNSGSWYRFLGLIKVDGKDINYFVYEDDQNLFSSSGGVSGFDSGGNGYEQEVAVEEMV